MEKEIRWLLKEKYNNKPTKQFINDVERLKAGEPVDYVIGFTEFLNCKIDLSKRPLIPRPETEYWVEREIKNILTVVKSTLSRDFHDDEIKVLDMFAGSGCIGIAVLFRLLQDLAVAGKNIRVDFADKDKKCLEQIKINLKLNQPSPKASAWRSKVIRSNVFSNIRGNYNYIFANPPYIATTRKNKIQKSVLKYEPREALFGGKDGLLYIRQFLKDARKHLYIGGEIFMEFDYVQKNDIEKIIKKYNYKNYKFYRDQYKKWRWVAVS